MFTIWVAASLGNFNTAGKGGKQTRHRMMAWALNGEACSLQDSAQDDKCFGVWETRGLGHSISGVSAILGLKMERSLLHPMGGLNHSLQATAQIPTPQPLSVRYEKPGSTPKLSCNPLNRP